MKLTIDNLDGAGAIDYSAAIDRSAPFAVARTLNAPSMVKGTLCLEDTGLEEAGLKVPVRRARMVVTADDGGVLFTGYLATEPVSVYAGVASAGPVYRLQIRAVSDEWLLDKQAAGAPVGLALGGSSGAALRALANRLDAGALNTSGIGAGVAVGVIAPDAAAVWSGHAGAVASAAYASYRALNGSLALTPAGETVHALSDGDGSLSVGGLRTAAVRELANDICVSGAMEPTAYWMELFAGDGTTAEFEFAGAPDAANAGKLAYLADSFDRGAIDTRTWAVADAGSHFGLSGSGFTMTGGNGIDGQTTLTAYDAIELGGTNVVELGGVTLGAGSAGVLGGLYVGVTLEANCFAGFNVRQAGGATVVTPLLNGVETGTIFTMVSGHAYTLRIHLHCAEMLRVKQIYRALVDGAVDAFGGGLMDGAASLVFEVRDEALSSNTPATILYDGSVASAPAQGTFVAVNSVQLYGSVASVRVTRSGSAWVTATDASSGTTSTKIMGAANEGADCGVSSSVTGKVTFWPGRIPAAGEIVTVLYRGRARAVARVADAASIAAEAAGGGVGTARWVGEVLQPVARSSEDCENAAQAILSFATNRAAAVAGTYDTVRPALEETGVGDVWPGDVLAITTSGVTTRVLVRKVAMEDTGASPEALRYRIAFANDWAEGLGIRLAETIARDALLPATALAFGAPAPVLANPAQMTVVASTSALTVDAGMAPPAGGGFEVRRRDGGFGTGIAGASGDLVLRSPVRGFSIPRAGFEEKFYVRMFDSAVPPRYSRESSAVVTHLPIA